MTSKRSIFSLLFFGVCLAYLSFLYLVGEVNTLNKRIVIISSNGFYPNKLRIQQSGTLVWINFRDKPVWPASNFHPTHSEYPEKGGCLGSALDACRGLSKFQIFSFIFKKTGEWGIHDHLFPADSMTVKVIAENDYSYFSDEIINYSLVPDENDFNKLSNQKKRETIISLSKKNPKAAWKYLKNATLLDNIENSGMHELAHIIGNSLFKKYGITGSAFCDNEYEYGCYHGVSEQLLVDEGPIMGIKNLEKECLGNLQYNEDQRNILTDPGCVHGAGHGLLTWNNLNLGLALSDCDNFSEAYRKFCYDGVFMEITFSMPIDEIEIDNPWDNCDLDKPEHREKCAGYLPFLISRVKTYDIEELFFICIDQPDMFMQAQCKRNLAFKIVQDSRGNLEKIMLSCEKIISVEAQNFCILWAAQSVRFHKFPDWEKVSESLCSSLSEPDLRECKQDKLGEV